MFVNYVSSGLFSFGEPTSLYTLLLFEELADAPEGGGSEDAEERREIDVGDEESRHATPETYNQIDNPGTGAEIVFRLDDDWVPNAYREKGHYGYCYACEVHYWGLKLFRGFYLLSLISNL